MNFLKNVWQEYDVPIICTFLLSALFAALIYVSVEDAKKWEMFAKEHNCKLIEKGTSDVIPTTSVSTSGSVIVGTAVVTTPDRYRCDDGIVYQR